MLLLITGGSGTATAISSFSSTSSSTSTTTTKTFRFLILGLIWLSLLQESTSTTTTTSTSTTSKTNTLITYPLIPHRAIVEEEEERRRNLASSAEVTEVVGQGQRKNRNLLRHNNNNRNRRTAEQQVGALYQGYGTHYVDLWCGTPTPQRQTVIVDTGSGTTAFPCSECTKCGVPDYHIDNLFQETQSSTYKVTTCTTSNQCHSSSSRSTCHDGHCKVSVSYSEGSKWDAIEATDLCYVAGPHHKPLVQNLDFITDPINPKHANSQSFDLTFGCQTLLTKLFLTQLADGIMGMNNSPSSYWKQMSNSGKLHTNQFALCFSRQPTVDRAGTEAGALTLGGSDERLHKTPMVYSSGATSFGRSGYWNVKVRKIYLRDGMTGGDSVIPTYEHPTLIQLDVDSNKLNQGGVIVDSGTTDTYWNIQLGSAFKQAYQKLSGREHSNNPITLSESELNSLPSIIFQLESNPITNDEYNNGNDVYNTPGLAGNFDKDNPYDVLLVIPPSHYMEYDSDRGQYTSRFYVTEGGGSVLGANAMMGHDVLFDADHDRIGWAESSCDYTSFVNDLGSSASSGGGGYDFTIPTDGKVQDGDVMSEEELQAAMDLVSAAAATATETSPSRVAGGESEGDDGGDDNDAEVVEFVEVDCHEEYIDRSMNLTEWDRIKNETAVGYCKVKNKAMKFISNCDGPECRYPVLVGLAVALCLGICIKPICQFLKWVLWCLCCCGCCCRCCNNNNKKNNSSNYDGVSSADDDDQEIELVNNGGGGGGYRDDPNNADDYDDEPPRRGFLARTKERTQYRDKPSSSSRGKKDTFKGDFKDFI